jgi:GntR family transcriptional regulator, transcriptional repressor for pyruvate dehydrogenase complex
LKKPVQKKASAVASAAERLRRLSMEKEEGAFLGSEEDLIAELGVSRPTLRQASAQVIQENLIAVRRGVGGGYFACVPNSMTVSRMAAIYLQSRKLHLPDILQALKPLRTEIAGLAAIHGRGTPNEDLVIFVETEEAELLEGTQPSYRGFLASEREFGRIIADLSKNDVLNLFLNIVYDLTPFTRRDEDVWVNHPERVEAYRRQRIQMAKAIRDGDDEIAKVASGRCSNLITEWTRADSTSKVA